MYSITGKYILCVDDTYFIMHCDRLTEIRLILLNIRYWEQYFHIEYHFVVCVIKQCFRVCACVRVCMGTSGEVVKYAIHCTRLKYRVVTATITK